MHLDLPNILEEEQEEEGNIDGDTNGEELGSIEEQGIVPGKFINYSINLIRINWPMHLMLNLFQKKHR